jgi:hypothetical protein
MTAARQRAITEKITRICRGSACTLTASGFPERHQ